MDARQYAPATQRNREPILAILARVIPPQSNVLEIASGTGEHGVFFASQLESCRWIPSDPNPLSRESIVAWKKSRNIANLSLPLPIDVTQNNWTQQLEGEIEGKKLKNQEIDAIININMIHISPWNACLGLISGAEKLLSPQGILYLYGPYKRNGKHTAPSNAIFDHSLRDRNPLWGIRDLEEVVETATAANLKLQEVINMPANNLSVIFSR
jgi:hypothetical protein